MKRILLLIVVSTLLSLSAFGRVRRVYVHGDQIVTIRTSLGIATIIQMPDRPNSVVVGDQSSFNVEYLDQAITIKPVVNGARSNLYIYTDWKRYNVELVTGSEAQAEYVVYLDSPKKQTSASIDNPGITWTIYKNTLRNEGIDLKVEKLGRTKDKILLIQFSVMSKRHENFKPDWLWLTQNTKTKPIHNLYLSSLNLRPGSLVSGVIQIKESDIEADIPIRVELRRKRRSYLTISKVNSWK